MRGTTKNIFKQSQTIFLRKKNVHGYFLMQRAYIFLRVKNIGSLHKNLLVAENGSGCKDTANVVVTVNPLPDFTLSKPVACPGTSEEVNITGLTNANTATAELKLDAGAYAAYPSPATVTGLSVGSHTRSLLNMGMGAKQLKV